MQQRDLERAITRAELVVRANAGKEAIAEEVNLARVFLKLRQILRAASEEYGLSSRDCEEALADFGTWEYMNPAPAIERENR